ncbi:hypothetical protein D3C76_1039680 [compost metagenome]
MNVSYDKASDTVNIVGASANNVSESASVGNKSGDVIVPSDTANEQILPQSQADVYYKVDDIEASELRTYFVKFDENNTVVIRVGGSSGEELTINRKKSVSDKQGNLYFPESFYLQYLTKEQLSKFQKYTYDANTNKTTPVN